VGEDPESIRPLSRRQQSLSFAIDHPINADYEPSPSH
jgi:hypothetical protein